MKSKTAELWAKQDQHQGDRWRLFLAVAETIDAKTVLYPGCFADIAPSFVFDSVTYLDIDKRTPTFFSDTDGIAEIIATHDGSANRTSPSFTATTRPVSPYRTITSIS